MGRGAVTVIRLWSGQAANGDSDARVILFLSTVLAGLIADQGSKWLVGSGLPLAHGSATVSGMGLSVVHNPGMLAGAGSSMPLLVEALTGLLLSLAALSAMSLLSSRRSQPRRLFALALVLAGGLGNLLDRMTTGGVVDFIQVGCLTLNVADFLLLAGGLLYGDPFQASERAPQSYGRFATADAPCAPAVCPGVSWAASATPAVMPRAAERAAATVAASTPRRSRFRRVERRTAPLSLR